MDNSRGQPLLERMALNALLRWRRKRTGDEAEDVLVLDMCDKADRLAEHNAGLSALVSKPRKAKRDRDATVLRAAELWYDKPTLARVKALHAAIERRRIAKRLEAGK